MGALKYVSLVVAAFAAAIGLVGRFQPTLFFKLPMGFIPWAITGHYVPPFMDNGFFKADNFREFARDGDVIAAVGAKSGTTWMCYCADAIRRKGVMEDEAKGLLPYTDIMYTTPWLEAAQIPGETWAERAEKYKNHVFEDGTRLRDYWDNKNYPFRVFKSHFTPDSATYDPYGNTLPITAYPKVKYVSVVRNGRDMAKSWYYFPGRHAEDFKRTWGDFPPPYPEGRPGYEAAMKDLMPGGNVYTLYFPYVRAWWEVRGEPNVLLLHYSDLVKGGLKTIDTLAAFYGVELSASERAAVGTMCSKAHMTEHQRAFDYKLAFNPDLESFMKPMQFINTADTSAYEVSDEALAAWDAACVAEFPDEKLLDWAANGGDF